MGRKSTKKKHSVRCVKNEIQSATQKINLNKWLCYGQLNLLRDDLSFTCLTVKTNVILNRGTEKECANTAL